MNDSPAVTPTPAQKAAGALTFLKNLVVEIATLQRPVTATAVAAFVLQITGVTSLDSATLAGILAGVGGLDAALEKFV